jgi:predicted dehydrogenase
MQRAREILESGELGAIKHAEAYMKAPKGLLPEDDIRFNYSLGGGAMMDMGCTWNSRPCTIQ